MVGLEDGETVLGRNAHMRVQEQSLIKHSGITMNNPESITGLPIYRWRLEWDGGPSTKNMTPSTAGDR
jgi:hypothetical protein